MKANFNIKVVLLILIFLFAFAIRLYQFSLFEYKNDQYFAIMQGNSSRSQHFLITHGMASGVRIDNPPFFLYFMGSITAFTNSPYYLTLIFFCINIIALIISFIYFFSALPMVFAIITSALLAVSPAFTIYCSNIWAQCLLPFLMILFNVFLYKFVIKKRLADFIILVILACFAAQLHMTGFFLFSLLLILLIIYRKEADKRLILFSGVLSFLMFLPYLIHIFLEKEIFRLFSYATSVERNIPWNVFREHLRMSSFDFFRYYFRYDFDSVLGAAAGAGRFIIYSLTWILSAFFVFGFIAYLKWLIKGRKFFNTDVNSTKNYPIPFQVSGFMVTIITLCYLVFRIKTPMHYFIIFFPAYSIITGFSAIRIWKLAWGKAAVAAGIISTAVLLLSILAFLDKAGGHYYEYGLTYKKMVSLSKEVKGLLPAGYCPDLKINFLGEGKTDVEAAQNLINQELKCPGKSALLPVQINIQWDEEGMQYKCLVKR